MKRFSDLRKEAGLTQVTLAAKVGVTQMAVSHWESGRRFPTMTTLRKIAEVLKLPPSDVMNSLI